MSDLEVPITTKPSGGWYYIQVVGKDGAVSDESTLVRVYPVDGIPAPKDVALCALDAQAAPCDGIIAAQHPRTLRLTFKNPTVDSDSLPTYFDCEFSTNPSSFSPRVLFSIFPYEHDKTAPYQHSIPIPDDLVGLVLFVRVRLPNDVAPGYWGTSSTGVAALRPPSTPSIVGLRSGGVATDGATLMLNVRRPLDLGDGGYGTAPTLVFEVFIATSGDVRQFFESGSSPPSTSFSTNPNTEITNMTLSPSAFGTESRAQVASMLSVRTTVFVWVRANNVNIQNTAFFSNISGSTTTQVTSEPGSISMATLSRIGPLAAKLSWAPPEDRGRGVSFDYPISYQYAEIASDTSTIAALQDIVTVEFSVQHVNLTDLQKGRLYFFSVRAVNDVGVGPWFNAGNCASYPSDTLPATCGLLALSFPESLGTPNLTQANGSLTATWQYPSDPGTGVAGPRVTLRYQIEFEDIQESTVTSTELSSLTSKTWSVLHGQTAGLTSVYPCDRTHVVSLLPILLTIVIRVCGH